RHLALADVEVARPQPAQPSRDLLLRGPAEQVEVQALRGAVRLRNAGEAQIQVGLPVDVQPGLEDPRLVGKGGGAERLLPEASEAAGIEGVDAEVLEEHPVTLRRDRKSVAARAAPRIRSPRRRPARAGPEGRRT